MESAVRKGRPPDTRKKEPMLEINASIEIDASASAVWRKLAKLDDVQHYVENVKKSYYSSELTEGVGAERICEVQGFGTLREKITQWQDGKSFTYAVEGMPSIIRRGRSTWRVEAITPEKARVSISSRLETRYGFVGTLIGRLMMRPQITRLLEEALLSFKDFVEQSAPSEGKAPRPLHAQVA